MQQALQGILVAGEKMRDDVLSGKKKITIREGLRDYKVGPVLIGCHILNWAHLTNITSVRHTILALVRGKELRAEGFKSIEEAIECLRQFYPAIGRDSKVTVVEWE